MPYTDIDVTLVNQRKFYSGGRMEELIIIQDIK